MVPTGFIVLELRYVKAMLFKNDCLSESNLEILKGFKRAFVEFTYAGVDLFKVSSVFGVIKEVLHCCIYSILFFKIKKKKKKKLLVFLHVNTSHICYGFSHLLPFCHKYCRALVYVSYNC